MVRGEKQDSLPHGITLASPVPASPMERNDTYHATNVIPVFSSWVNLLSFSLQFVKGDHPVSLDDLGR